MKEQLRRNYDGIQSNATVKKETSSVHTRQRMMNGYSYDIDENTSKYNEFGNTEQNFD